MSLPVTAWAAELRRRVAEVDSGQVRPVPWDGARRQVQAQLDAGTLLQRVREDPQAHAADEDAGVRSCPVRGFPVP